MNQVSVINSIEVPDGLEDEAIKIRDIYINYFKTKPGFVSSTFYKSINDNNKFNFVNIVVWDSKESFEAVVNSGFENKDGLNQDNMKVLGKGFPEPIKVSPGQFEIIRID
ncbi:MAG: antibiotic biosynthesis monooxygenase [Saprospiraceae bacterium]